MSRGFLDDSFDSLTVNGIVLLPTLDRGIGKRNESAADQYPRVFSFRLERSDEPKSRAAAVTLIHNNQLIRKIVLAEQVDLTVHGAAARLGIAECECFRGRERVAFIRFDQADLVQIPLPLPAGGLDHDAGKQHANQCDEG